MKTAMQELIEKLDYSIKNSKDDYKINFEWIKFHAESLLEKEKEQTIDAMERSAIYVSASSLDKEIGKITFEDLYNQTYNKID